MTGKRLVLDDKDSGDEGYSSDPDGFAAAQWVDEDDLDVLEEEIEGENGGEENLADIQKDLATLPFGALAKASKALKSQVDESNDDTSDNEDDSEDDESGDAAPQPRASTSRAEFGKPPKKVKRHDKHAPMEISSKKPVTRRRTVVEVPKIELRDPRFSTLSGEFNAEKFDSSYSFLANIQENEVADLRKSLSLARKLAYSSPAHLREERAAEVARLERTLKRAESSVERVKREKRKREVLSEAKKEEREKRMQGKGSWFMKSSEKQQLLTKARFEDLAASGKGAVKKAITKRKLKISQKEKRNRPGPNPMAGRSRDGGEPSAKRPRRA